MGQPLLHGGGAIEFVTLEDLIWADVPERYEAGSPNVVGAVALGAACDALLEIGMQNVADHERTLSERLGRASRAWTVSERSGCGPMLPSTESALPPSTSMDIATRCWRRS
jgi:selenocysteine lyase/cysteine desulfurase